MSIFGTQFVVLPNKEDFLAGQLRVHEVDVFFSCSSCEACESTGAQGACLIPELFVSACGFGSG